MQNTLEQRLSDLAKSKSRLELINRLLISLSSVAGLDNMVQHTLEILMQTIGAANITIIYRLNTSWQFRDIYGVSREFREQDDPNFQAALANGKPLRISDSGVRIPYPGECGSVAVENWYFPLLSRDRKIGVVCMEGMQITDLSIFEELQPFFIYAGLMLDNEISNYTQLAEAHQRLQESETLYRTLFEQLPDGVVLWDSATLRPFQFNTAAHTMLGYSSEEFASLTVTDFEAVHDRAEIERTRELLARQGTASFESVHRTRTGENRSMWISLKTLEVSDRQLILAIQRDVTQQKRAEEESRNIQELFNLFMQYTPVYTFIKEVDGSQSRVVQISDNFIDMVGIPADELRGRTMEDVFPAEFARKITEDDISLVRTGTVFQQEEMLNGRSYITIKFPMSRRASTAS